MLRIRGNQKQGWLSYLTNSIYVAILFKNPTVDFYFIYQNHQICRYIVLLFRVNISTRMEGGDYYQLELLE